MNPFLIQGLKQERILFQRWVGRGYPKPQPSLRLILFLPLLPQFSASKKEGSMSGLQWMPPSCLGHELRFGHSDQHTTGGPGMYAELDISPTWILSLKTKMISRRLCLFLRVAVTNCHKWCSFNPQKITLMVLEVRSLNIKCQQCWLLAKALEENLRQAASYHLTVLSSLWCVTACDASLISSSVLPQYSPLCLSPSLLSCLFCRYFS